MELIREYNDDESSPVGSNPVAMPSDPPPQHGGPIAAAGPGKSRPGVLLSTRPSCSVGGVPTNGRTLGRALIAAAADN